jgi:PAS domain-containing protein
MLRQTTYDIIVIKNGSLRRLRFTNTRALKLPIRHKDTLRTALLVDSRRSVRLIDRDFRIVTVNKAYEKTYGRPDNRWVCTAKISHEMMRRVAGRERIARTRISLKTARKVPAYTSTTTNNTASTRCG